MKVILASDSFKGSCTAAEAAAAMERGLRRVFPEAETVLLPLADGGEGTVDAFLSARGGEKVYAPAHDPLGRPIRAAYARLPGGRAVIETAAASGLTLLRPEERDVLRADSFGTGELLRHALLHGAREIILGLGGSATCDGGTGFARALGVSFRDREGRELPPGGGALRELASVSAEKLLPEAREARILAACDVKNPLCGPNGAAAVFGPQKGASPEEVELLDEGLGRLGAILRRDFGCPAAEQEGAGAAGGFPCVLLAFFRTELRRGIELLLEETDFDAQVAGAQLLLTGEGRLDAQSAWGKLPAGVAARARRIKNIPVLAIGGAIGEGAEALYACGVDGLAAAVADISTLEAAMARTIPALEAAAERTVRIFRAGWEAGRAEKRSSQ